MAFSWYFWPYLRWYHSTLALVKLTSGLDWYCGIGVRRPCNESINHQAPVIPMNIHVGLSKTRAYGYPPNWIVSHHTFPHLKMTTQNGALPYFFTGRARCNSHSESQTGGRQSGGRWHVFGTMSLLKLAYRKMYRNTQLDAWKENTSVVVLPTFQRQGKRKSNLQQNRLLWHSQETVVDFFIGRLGLGCHIKS